MKVPYYNELYELQKWIDAINANLSLQMQFCRYASEMQHIRQCISAVAEGIANEYPFYSAALPHISNGLFISNGNQVNLNPIAFGELAIIIQHIANEPCPAPFWPTIHPRIHKTSIDLYKDGHYDSAAEKAIKEVEMRLREKFSELKPGAHIPTQIGDVIGALLSETGAFKLCDTSSTSGKNFRRGILSIFEGVMTAYRNPSAHANLQYSQREAMEQIALASQLMYILEKPQI